MNSLWQWLGTAPGGALCAVLAWGLIRLIFKSPRRPSNMLGEADFRFPYSANQFCKVCGAHHDNLTIKSVGRRRIRWWHRDDEPLQHLRITCCACGGAFNTKLRCESDEYD